ncbi:MAG: long-chain fatty acid--CoA ligase [Deltaproteobacteria bacterium]|nr:MAG: long-chain fatty acid--CoA ligase [Deltaproteobacteria bacterium]
MAHPSVAHLFQWRVEQTPDRIAFTFPDKNEDWQQLTWSQTNDRVRAIASGLRALGIEDEQRVGILSVTRVEWILADLGVLCAGAATTTVYPSNTPDECQYILEDSATRILFAEDDDQVAKILEVREKLPKLQHVIVIDGKPQEDGFVLTLAQLEEKGKTYDAENPEAFQAVIDAIEPQRLATLIYTSGTTGQPKGVELLHDCWVFEAEAMEKVAVFREDDMQFLWLPMSHSFGKVLEVACLQAGFITAVDGRIPRIVDNLGVIKPTFMAAAPRIFEKVYNKVVTTAEEAGGLKLKIFRWALGVGRQVSALRQQGKEPGGLLAIQNMIADKLVFSKLRDRFGGRIRFFISGSAPLSREMAEFFHAAGILILEGYGLTESSAASFVNLPDNFAFGTVGPALPGVECQIAESNGEILLRGRGIMRGYHNLPEQTAETLDDEGWLHTGDVGEFDESGKLKITDRIKDLIKTSGGKYVAPQALESSLKALCPYLSQVVVHGNNRNFCTALVTLDEENSKGWLEERGLGNKTIPELAQDPTVVAMVQEAIDKLNANLASYETIKKFAILPSDFTVEDGELTASLKVKRKVVEKKYKDILDGFYEGALKAI